MAAVGVMGDWGSHHVVGLIVPVLILGVPIFDMTFTTIMRIYGGQVRSIRQWLEFTGRDHIHHRLEDLRMGRVGAVFVVYIVTIWLGLSALALAGSTGINAALQVAQSVVVFLLLGFFMVFVRRQYSYLEEQEGQGHAVDGESSSCPAPAPSRPTWLAAGTACFPDSGCAQVAAAGDGR